MFHVYHIYVTSSTLPFHLNLESVHKGIRSIFYGRRTLRLAEIGPDKEKK